MKPHPRRPLLATSSLDSWDDVLLLMMGLCLAPLTAAGLLTWLAGQVSGLLAHGRWPSTPLGVAPHLLARLPGSLSQLDTAWPTPYRRQLGPNVLTVLVLCGLFVASVSGTLIACQAGWRWRAGRRRREQRSSAQWARTAQIRPLHVDAPHRGRLLLGQLGRHWVAAERHRSLIVAAPTQAGKTTRVVVPNLVCWDGPAVVTSVKPDVLDLTIAARLGRGQVHVFDPLAITGQPSVRWSPLQACTDYEAAERMATWLVEAGSELGRSEVNNGRFWELLGGKLLGALLFAAAGCDAQLADVARWVDRQDAIEVTAILDALGEGDALDAFTASINREPRQRDSVFATVESVLRGLTSPSVRGAVTVTADDIANGNILDPQRLLDANETLYLVAPAHEQSRLKPLFVALVQHVLREAAIRHSVTGAPLDPPLLVMLDEAAHIAPLRDLATLAATGAGQGIVLTTIWQDLAQITTVYGQHAAATIVNNHTARLFLPGSSDVTTLEAASKLIGEQPADRVSVTTSAEGSRSASANDVDSRVAPIDTLRQLSADEAVVIYGRFPPMRLRLPGWWEHPFVEQPSPSPAPRRPANPASNPPPWPSRAASHIATDADELPPWDESLDSPEALPAADETSTS